MRPAANLLDRFNPGGGRSTHRSTRAQVFVLTARLRSYLVEVAAAHVKFGCIAFEIKTVVLLGPTPNKSSLVQRFEAGYSVYVDAITRQQAVRRLIAAESKILALGVERLALFGSVARDEARPDSDIDLLVHFSPDAKTYVRFLALSELLEDLLGRKVELVTAESLSPFLGPKILQEAQDVIGVSQLPSPYLA